MRSRIKPRKEVNIAEERIKILFREARKRPEKGTRYVFLARKIAKKYNIKLKKDFKRTYCHHCYAYFVSPKVRTNPKTKCVEYHCPDCNKVTRYGYSKEKDAD